MSAGTLQSPRWVSSAPEGSGHHVFKDQDDVDGLGPSIFDSLKAEDLRPEVREAVEGYSSFGHKVVNRMLRDDARLFPFVRRRLQGRDGKLQYLLLCLGTNSESSSEYRLKQRELVGLGRRLATNCRSTLSAELQGHVVRQPFVTHRVLDRAALRQMLEAGGKPLPAWRGRCDLAPEDLHGMRLREPAFCSTALVANETAKYEGDVMLEILVEPGAKGAAIHECSTHPCETEFVLSPNQRFEVLAAEQRRIQLGGSLEPRDMLFVRCRALPGG